jgi:hypothetical protein
MIENDYPETEDEDDPVGLLGWPTADKSRDKDRSSVVGAMQGFLSASFDMTQ